MNHDGDVLKEDRLLDGNEVTHDLCIDQLLHYAYRSSFEVRIRTTAMIFNSLGQLNDPNILWMLVYCICIYQRYQPPLPRVSTF